MRRIQIACVLSVTTAACSLLYDVDTLGPGTNPDDGGGLATTDADADGQSPADATAGFCATTTPRPAFCADFDDVSNLKRGWANEGIVPDTVGETAGNTILLDTGPSLDGTHAVAMDLLAKSRGDTVGQGTLIKLFDALPKGFSLLAHMQIRIDTKPPYATQSYAPIVVGFGPSGAVGQIVLLRAAGGDTLAVSEGRTVERYVQFASIPDGQWTDLRLELSTLGTLPACIPDAGAVEDSGDGAGANDGGSSEGSDGGGTALFLVNGQPMACLALPASFATVTSGMILIGGVGGLAPIAPLHVAFDDVAVYF